MKLSVIITALFLATIIGITTGCQKKPSNTKRVELQHHDHEGHDHDAHEGHDHSDDNSRSDHSDHRGHEHDGHDHGEHHEGSGVTLDKNAQQIAGIRLDTVKKSTLTRTVDLPGRVGFDEDRLVHITSRFGGVIREVNVSVGAKVKNDALLATLENNSTMSSYSIRAPVSGTIIEKHATLGESVSDDRELFVLADLSRVWINCNVYSSDIDLLENGMTATITSIDKKLQSSGNISYISPVFNQSSSTGYARIVIANKQRNWRPGMFVRATIEVTNKDSVLTVGNDAVQVVDGESVLFIPGPANSFFTRPVKTGRRTPEVTEILDGVATGETYVAQGAFELKATLVTSGMDPHAGHGH
jgi:cobalt-zinc-cadmium efflux system membrane fusion protein